MFDEKGRFILRNYQQLPTFSSFLPGIAGENGVPVWCFYNNRGQAVCSFGVNNKDHAIMEFSPARESYRDVSRTGFRTFCKVNGRFDELFTENCDMYIGAGEVEIICSKDGVDASAVYFGLPEERTAALVRVLTLRNAGKEDLTIELLDGIPELVPYGVSHRNLKDMNNLAQAWMRTEIADNGLAFFGIRASLEDTASVTRTESRNFCAAYDESGNILCPIVQTDLIFGTDTSLSKPVGFIDRSAEELSRAEQVTENRFPCCFLPKTAVIPSGGEIKIYSLFGNTENKERAAALAKKITGTEWFENKRKRASALIAELCAPVSCRTKDPVFDAYCRQTFLDNALRGGVPIFFEEVKRSVPFYIYSRKHGDPEREYNAFSLGDEYYAQGNGNYRDVNQNRRSDVLFFPKLGEENIRTFFELIQPDGYNPLVLTAQSYTVSPEFIPDILERITEAFRPQMKRLLEKPFTPGRLAMAAEDMGMTFEESRAFTAAAVCAGEREACADFTEGYWCDHWTYNLDLIESFLAVYPDKKQELLFDRPDYRWYAPTVQVLPREKRYCATENGLRRYNSLSEPTETSGRWVRADDAEARSALIEKLLLLCTIKTMTLDAAGMGIEMEGGKPGWYDALNGLPGILGSSMAESCELARLISFTRGALAERGGNITLFKEIAELIIDMADDLKCGSAYERWDKMNRHKEMYRAKTASGFDGERISVDCASLDKLLMNAENTVRNGINAATLQGSGMMPTYFTFEAANTADGVIPSELTPRPLPIFLEGFVHLLKLDASEEGKAFLAERIHDSDLYDKKLKMYKVNADLSGVSFEAGRAVAFTPGWLENESVWLHMEYKYLLELLKSGLYKQYAKAFREAAVPFLDPVRYGRSPLENVSFIASSANPDPSLWGRGFVARASGSTAEFLQMWQIMFFGKTPFRMRDNKLTLTFEPFIPDYLIPENGEIKTTFLGKIGVIYHVGKSSALIPGETVPKRWTLIERSGEKRTVEGDHLPEKDALAIRNGEIAQIDIEINSRS